MSRAPHSPAILRRAAGSFGLAALAGLAAACSSSTHHTATIPGGTEQTLPTVTTSTPTTVAGQLPTAFDCGGGSYEPAMLIIVCGGVDATNATGVHWRSWTATAASGTGTVHIQGASEPAALALSDVKPTSNGPQFSTLVATWSGPPTTWPNHQSTETFHLDTATPS